MRVRLKATDVVVHDALSGCLTNCSVLFGSSPGVFGLFAANTEYTLTEDPVDCMTCLVRMGKDLNGKMTLYLTNTVPIIECTITLESKPKK